MNGVAITVHKNYFFLAFSFFKSNLTTWLTGIFPRKEVPFEKGDARQLRKTSSNRVQFVSIILFS